MLKSQVSEIPTEWKEVIESYIEDNENHWNILEKMYNQSSENNNIFPYLSNIFKCFHYFNPEDTKVVIIGQDPYHGTCGTCGTCYITCQATGLSFAVNKDCKKPPSLKNIEKELIKDYQQTLEDSSLEKWAKQKILMLNISLTVLESKPGSHIKFWTPFTYYILSYITKNVNKVVFVAWGGFAYNVLADIQPDTQGKEHEHKCIIRSHPSPLGYSKTMRGHKSFKDSNVFKEINNSLIEKINW